MSPSELAAVWPPTAAAAAIAGPFRAGRHPYTRNRVQEAIPAAHTADGTGEAEDASPSQNCLLHATFAESGASSADEEG